MRFLDPPAMRARECRHRVHQGDASGSPPGRSPRRGSVPARSASWRRPNPPRPSRAARAARDRAPGRVEPSPRSSVRPRRVRHEPVAVRRSGGVPRRRAGARRTACHRPLGTPSRRVPRLGPSAPGRAPRPPRAEARRRRRACPTPSRRAWRACGWRPTPNGAPGHRRRRPGGCWRMPLPSAGTSASWSSLKSVEPALQRVVAPCPMYELAWRHSSSPDCSGSPAATACWIAESTSPCSSYHALARA